MITARPRVSAIIIVLNGEQFIEEAIDSVLDQTCPDWELIVVDDGSTDRTLPLVRRFVGQHPERIRLIWHADGGNHGMSASRNLGLGQARGEYVAFLDADDVWLPTKLAEQVAVLDAEPSTGMVYGRTLIWHSWERGSARADYFYDLGVPADATYRPPLLCRQLLRNRYQTPTTCNAMVRRDAAAVVGGFDPAFADMFEDQLFFAKVLLSYPTHVSGRCWARYRQHPGATSTGYHNRLRVAEAQLRYLRALRGHLRAGRHRSPTVRLPLEAKISMLAVGTRLRAVRRRARRLLGRKHG